MSDDNRTDRLADSLADYSALLAKVSEKFDEIFARNRKSMLCGRGCSSCCVPKLTVFEVERENIRRFIDARPGLSAELLQLEAANPHQGQRCAFLDVDGSCAIYEARPIVCRSHGAPIFASGLEGPQRDVCPLNFSGENLDEILKDDFINLDLLNQLLVLINRKFGGEGARAGLRVSEILGTDE